MPEISRFLGIVITMYFEDHAPPHFHARYGNYRIKMAIDDGEVEGLFPPRALALVHEWRKQHVTELQDDWTRAQANQQLRRIEGLE